MRIVSRSVRGNIDSMKVIRYFGAKNKSSAKDEIYGVFEIDIIFIINS